MHLAIVTLYEGIEGQEIFWQIVDDQQFGDGLA